MTTSELAELVRRHGVNAKLKSAIMRTYGWRHDAAGPPLDDWYREWPSLASQLDHAIRISQGHQQ